MAELTTRVEALEKRLQEASKVRLWESTHDCVLDITNHIIEPCGD